MCSFLKWAQIPQSGCVCIGDASQPPQELVVSSWGNFTTAQVLKWSHSPFPPLPRIKALCRKGVEVPESVKTGRGITESSI